MPCSLKISVIVPVHNSATTIDRCIKSIVDQPYKNFECILIENGSSDDSKEICQKYVEAYECVKFAVSPKIGVSAARNLGLLMATGDIIGFCDADDFLEPNSMQKVLSAFLDNPDINGVFSAFYVGIENQSGIKKEYKVLKKERLTIEDAIMRTLGDNSTMGSVWNRYYRADVAQKISFDTMLSYCEDTHYNIKLLSNIQDAELAYVQEPLYCYMLNDRSVTHQLDKLYDENGELKYITALKKIMQECNLNKKCLRIAKMKIVILAIDSLWCGGGNNQQKNNLKNEIRQNLKHFLYNIYRFGFVRNMKRLIKLLLVWTK